MIGQHRLLLKRYEQERDSLVSELDELTNELAKSASSREHVLDVNQVTFQCCPFCSCLFQFQIVCCCPLSLIRCLVNLIGNFILSSCLHRYHLCSLSLGALQVLQGRHTELSQQLEQLKRALAEAQRAKVQDADGDNAEVHARCCVYVIL